jgi:hypothetical protein
LSLFDKVNLISKWNLHFLILWPIILYSSEVWGIYEFPEVDKIHIKFCKLVLGVKQQTPNLAVLGELGR